MDFKKNSIDELNDLRYNFEHYLLPGWFYRDKDRFTNALINGDTFIDGIFFKICKDKGMVDVWIKGYDNIYAEDDNLKSIIITCPNCIATPQCSKIFMIWNEDKRFYFTLEYDDMMEKLTGIEPFFILCGWDEKQAHVNFGPFNESNDKLIAKIKELFEEI